MPVVVQKKLTENSQLMESPLKSLDPEVDEIMVSLVYIPGRYLVEEIYNDC